MNFKKPDALCCCCTNVGKQGYHPSDSIRGNNFKRKEGRFFTEGDEACVERLWVPKAMDGTWAASAGGDK